ncbi:uncharacterized protein LOC116212248 [Punica granatum]|nr:uncharacterized protein LOC116190385 [Punica granatum]XP_031402675.1 uncharacterized protein LOC116212248 [Punica granatum]OWM75915.1 hypothetical protein CDL15_Pgr009559 [Punica granatum]
MDIPPPPPPPPVPALDFLTVISEARRIVNAHSRHFLALSVLFLLPLSFSLTVYPTLLSLTSSAGPNSAAPQSLLSLHHRSDSSNTIAATLAFTAFLSLFSLFAASSITHSTVQGFYGRPVKLLPAIKSIFTSFFPLSVTVLCIQLIQGLILAILGLFVFLVVKLVELIWHRIEYSSPYFVGFVALITLAFVVIVFYLQVEWALVYVLVVAESVWGFYPLKRSTYLVKGMRKVALCLNLFFGFAPGILLCASSMHSNTGWKSWAFVVEIVALSSVLTMFMLLHLAANVVLYMYCKAIHGELAMEIAEEFARDYVSLPFDEGKVPHVVSVAYT